MRETVVRHIITGNHYLSREENLHREYRVAEQVAIHGSQELKDGLESAFSKFADRHRITEGEARHLLLNTGVRLPA